MAFKCFPDGGQFNGEVTEKKKCHEAVDGKCLEMKTEVRINDPGCHG